MKSGDFLLIGLTLCFLQDLLPIPFINYFDEIIMIAALINIFYNGLLSLAKFKLDLIFLSILLLLGTQVLNYYQSPFSNSFLLGMVQVVIHIKAFLILYLAISMYPKMTTSWIKVCFSFCFALASFGLIVNLLLGEAWHTFMGIVAKYRNGMIRPISIFENTANLGYFFALFSSVFFVNSKSFLSKNNIYYYFSLKIIIDIILMQVITVRKMIIGVIPVLFLIFKKENKINKSIYFIICSFLFGIMFFILEDTFFFQETVLNLSKFNSDDHHYIRGLMFYYGGLLFIENFPFGVGAGTFGTIISTINTLEVYSYVGLDLGWLTNASGKYVGIFDNGVGAYIGENGFIGLISLFYFLKVIYSKLKTENFDIIFCVFWFTIITSLIGPAWQDGVYSSILSLVSLYGFMRVNK